MYRNLKRNSIYYAISNILINTTSTVEYLSIANDSALSFESQINKIEAKISAVLEIHFGLQRITLKNVNLIS